MAIRLKIEALRSNKEMNDDDVILSMKYQVTSQEVIPVEADLKVVGEHDEMEEEVVEERLTDLTSKFEDNGNSLVCFIADGKESFGIDDVNAYMDMIIEDATNKILKEAADKVEHEYVKELVDNLDREAAEQAKC
ncbi:hypothetical protein Dimus_028636 [Dionaea muscipula]